MVATINCNCSGGGATVSLLDGGGGGGRPIAGFSGAAAAVVPSGALGDGVALPLVFVERGSHTDVLPAASTGNDGLRFRVEMGRSGGGQLFGITLRCRRPGEPPGL